jgi:L-aspartate oxidase
MKPSVETVDFLIIGGGVAGLRAAIELAPRGDVLILTKDKSTESSTEYAQGGVAVALSDEDEVCIHYDDTIRAGDGLCREDAVSVLVEEGPGYILELISWGAAFDREGSRLAFTREAAHSRKRILHAHGDSTGREMERTLIARARSFPSIKRYDFAFTIDLLIQDGRCVGAVVLRKNRIIIVRAKAVVLATGGAGQVYGRTTNPVIATGDGIAIAYRAGAMLEDMEFVQFHPTTLFAPGAPQFLLSEAMRGEGAELRNIHGERFMPGYHELAELAPRDVVTRAIVSEMVKTGSSHVYLDMTHLDRDFVMKRFPQIYSTCLQYQIDITEDKVPVCPAAHYFMGGVKTGLDGETSIDGLFAAGEVACTGVHGANRLASNSLLEGIVFGARTGKKAAEFAEQNGHGQWRESDIHCPEPSEPDSLALLEEEKMRTSLRRMMWERVGIIRCNESLTVAMKWLDDHKLSNSVAARRHFEHMNMHTVATLIAASALFRKGSVGAHYRSDFKDRGENWQAHVRCSKDQAPHWGD